MGSWEWNVARGSTVWDQGQCEIFGVDPGTFVPTVDSVRPLISPDDFELLERAFRTDSFRIKVTINPDGTWSYFEDTVLTIAGRPEPFHHTDTNTLTRIAPPTPNPLARAAS